MVLLLRNRYLYFTKDPEAIHFFWGGGGVNFFRGGGGGGGGGGVLMLISIETHIRTCYFPGGCPDPLSPTGSFMGNVIIT